MSHCGGGILLKLLLKHRGGGSREKITRQRTSSPLFSTVFPSSANFLRFLAGFLSGSKRQSKKKNTESPCFAQRLAEWDFFFSLLSKLRVWRVKSLEGEMDGSRQRSARGSPHISSRGLGLRSTLLLGCPPPALATHQTQAPAANPRGGRLFAWHKGGRAGLPPSSCLTCQAEMFEDSGEGGDRHCWGSIHGQKKASRAEHRGTPSKAPGPSHQTPQCEQPLKRTSFPGHREKA